VGVRFMTACVKWLASGCARKPTSIHRLANKAEMEVGRSSVDDLSRLDVISFSKDGSSSKTNLITDYEG
jgi:hypothetical protein